MSIAVLWGFSRSCTKTTTKNLAQRKNNCLLQFSNDIFFFFQLSQAVGSQSTTSICIYSVLFGFFFCYLACLLFYLTTNICFLLFDSYISLKFLLAALSRLISVRMRNVSLPRSCTLLHLFILQIAISLLCRFLLSVTTQLQLLLLFAALTCRRSASLWFRIVAEYWLPARRLSLIWLIFYCRFAYARTLQVEVSGTYKYLLLYLLW